MVFYETAQGKMNATSLVGIQVMSWNSCVLKHQATDPKQYYKGVGKGINFEPSNKTEAFQSSKPSRDTSAHKK